VRRCELDLVVPVTVQD